MAVIAQIDRAFVVAAFARQEPSASRNRIDGTTYRADPAFEPLPRHTDAPANVHHWNFALCNQLEGLGSAYTEEAGYFATVQQERVRGTTLPRRH